MGGAGFAAGAGVGVGTLLVWQYRLRRQVAAIRYGVQRVVASGATDFRLADGVRHGRLHALVESIDELVSASMDRCRQTEQAKTIQHQYWRRRYLQRRLGGEYTNRQAQSVVDESSGMTKLALMQVVEHAQAVLGTTRTIEESVRSVIERTQAVVESTNRAALVLQDFEGSFQRVGGITEFISTVAKQTALLSLNAGIEAARAAAAGKGFGVVAQEVKALAAETSHSASEIAETVGLLRGEVSEMGKAIAGVTAGIAHIEDATATVNATVVDQRTTLEELDLCVHDVISQMDLLAMLAHDLDRRRHPRAVVDGAVQLHAVTGTVIGDLLDLSEGGMRCAIERCAPIEVATKLRLTFTVGQAEHSVAAVVVRRDNGDRRDQIGLEFEELSGEPKEAILTCISELLESDEELES
jgi:methyl-accepting chemotaxis protein